MQGGFFDWPSQFSAPKRKTKCCQPNLMIFYVLKLGKAKKLTTLYVK